MLPKSHRLLKRDFSFIKRAAFSVRGMIVTLRVLRTPGTTPARAGIIIPKKLLAKATARNRARRRIRGVLIPLLPKLPFGTLLLVLGRASAERIQISELRAELIGLLRRAKLLS
jgi:ribonuclease P protein component